MVEDNAELEKGPATLTYLTPGLRWQAINYGLVAESGRSEGRKYSQKDITIVAHDGLAILNQSIQIKI